MSLEKKTLADALAAMKGICSSPESPNALPEVINQLTDILGNVFDDLTLPDPPQLDTGEFGFPEDAPFDFPLGGGDFPPFDPIEGFDGGFPGGGEEFGPGGEDGGGGGEGEVGPCIDAFEKHITFFGNTEGEIPAAEDGVPGVGLVEKQAVNQVPQGFLCERDCWANFQADQVNIQNQINSRIASIREGRSTRDKSNDIPFFGSDMAGDFNADELTDDIKELKKLLTRKYNDYLDCVKMCQGGAGNQAEELVSGTGEIFSVKNISCEVIEADTQVVVSGTVTVAETEQGDITCAPDDLYVMVESCGCD